MLQMKTIELQTSAVIKDMLSLKLNTQATNPHSTLHICMLATMPITDTTVRSASNCDITEALKTEPISL